jgi:hypothetical protein
MNEPLRTRKKEASNVKLKGQTEKAQTFNKKEQFENQWKMLPHRLKEGKQ